MQLAGLDLTPRLRGQAPQHLAVELVRPLRVEDVPLLNSPDRLPGNALLKRITDRHHAVARLIAGGMGYEEAGMITGYAPGRLAVLKTDIAFRELIEFYRTSLDREMRSNFQRMSGLAATAADILQDRMEDEPDDLTVGQLVEITKMGADRSGLGPSSTNVTLNVNMGLADKMKRAREQARRAQQPQTIEGEAFDITPKG